MAAGINSGDEAQIKRDLRKDTAYLAEGLAAIAKLTYSQTVLEILIAQRLRPYLENHGKTLDEVVIPGSTTERSRR